MIRKAFVLMLSVIVLSVMLANVLKTGAGSETAVPVTANAGTSFTYQGYLESDGSPMNNACDFQFSLFDTAAGGGQVGTTLTIYSQGVTDGLFTVQLDFGFGVFDGAARWLEISVRCPAGSGNYAPLTPRQALTPTPYAIFSTWAGSAPWADLTGIPAGFSDDIDNDTLASLSCANGELPAWNASSGQWGCAGNQGASYTAGTGLSLAGTVFSLDSIYTDSRYWSLTGNAGTTTGANYLGTTNNVSLTLAVSGTAALQLIPAANSPNLIGGFNGNSITAGFEGATISGGGIRYGPNQIAASYAAIGGGYGNIVNGEYGTVGGGTGNIISGTLDSGATIGGGVSNSASERFTVISGGSGNEAGALLATVGGGGGNTAWGGSTTVGGGNSNSAVGQYATVGGGRNNAITGTYGTIAGGGYWQGFGNRVTDDGGAIGGGGNNQTGNNSGSTIDAYYSTVSGGWTNIASGAYATISGGQGNTASGGSGVISGGWSNTAAAPYTVVSGGYGNVVTDDYGVIGGGHNVVVTGTAATVAGGAYNNVSANYATIAGGGPAIPNDPLNTGNLITDNYGVIGGGGNNQAGDNTGTTTDAQYATVGGGESNEATGAYSTIGGGGINTASGHNTTIGGGVNNTADASGSVVGGGVTNNVSAVNATIGGGAWNTNNGWDATIGGGSNNIASGIAAAIAGGQYITATGWYATVPGGQHNTAAGMGSFAAGQYATASHDGSFVWGDGTSSAYSTNSNQFLALASNGVGFYTSFGSCTFFSGANWTCSSDRSLKENFTSVEPREILAQLAQVPITRWNMKGQDPDVYHFGPVAQDFYAAFGLGEDNEHINTGDAQGVGFAAIQGLYEITREQELTIAALKTQNADLEARLTALEEAFEVMPASAASIGWKQWWPIGLLLVGLVLGQHHTWGGRP